MILAIAGIFLVLGIFVCFSSVLGLFRFRTVLNRIHALALMDTLGLLLVAIGAVVLRGWSLAALKLLLIPAFLCLTGPVLTQLLAKVEILYFGETYPEYREEETR